MSSSRPVANAATVAGARKLDHRTADAVEWLTDPYRTIDRFEVMRRLPDLEATPQLCAAGLSWTREEFARTYRPTPNHSLPYGELEERLGAGNPLVALPWLAGHGCDAEAELKAAESLLDGYGETPRRAAMLAALAALHRKP